MTTPDRGTRDKLLEATVRLVNEVGYTRTTTRAIAQAAGVAEGTIYRHFPDKSSLFFAAVLARNSEVTDWVTELPDRAGSRTVADNLTDCLDRLMTLRRDVIPLEFALLTDPELARQVPGPADQPPGPPAALAAYLAAEQRLGRVRADVDPRQAAVLLLAALFGLALAPTGPAGNGMVPTLAEAVAIVVGGLQPVSPNG